MNEKVTALGAIVFVLGAVINLSAVGAAAAGNVLFANVYFNPGLAAELVAYVILGVGVVMKGKGGGMQATAKNGPQASGSTPRVSAPEPSHESRKADKPHV